MLQASPINPDGTLVHLPDGKAPTGPRPKHQLRNPFFVDTLPGVENVDEFFDAGGAVGVELVGPPTSPDGGDDVRLDPFAHGHAALQLGKTANRVTAESLANRLRAVTGFPVHVSLHREPYSTYRYVLYPSPHKPLSGLCAEPLFARCTREQAHVRAQIPFNAERLASNFYKPPKDDKDKPQKPTPLTWFAIIKREKIW